MLARAIGGRRHELMYRTMEVSGSTMASWYFTSFFFCVGLVLTDLATAVVLEIFWSVHESALDQDKALAEAAQATQAMMSAKSGDSGFSAGLGVAQLPVRLDGGGGDGGGGGGGEGGGGVGRVNAAAEEEADEDLVVEVEISLERGEELTAAGE